MRSICFLWMCLTIFNIRIFKLYLCQQFFEPKILNDFEESFVLNDLEYIFANQKVTWEEADIGCSAIETGSLAIIDNMQKANFLALALAETDLVVEDLWVGAFAQPCPKEWNNTLMKTHCAEHNNSYFKWETGDIINYTLLLSRKKEVTATQRECLSFARNYHQEPTFVDLACELKRPYMCQRPSQQEEGQITHLEWIRIGDWEYAIFYDKKTWKESVKECFNKHQAHLANFRRMEEVSGIGKYLLTGRPSLENAWIGGHFKSGKWRYISIEDTIPDEKHPQTMYPPWRDSNHTVAKDGCLLLDRHLDDGRRLIFLPSRCHRKKSYICSRRTSGSDQLPYEIIVMDDICYTLFYSPKTWFEADDICTSRGAWLVEVTEEKLDNVLYIMGENRTEINHIWIGGRLQPDNTWVWVKSKEIIENGTHKIFNGYPPWIDYIFDQKYACLNLDRENHNVAMFYGVYCEAKQPFICQQYYTDISTNRPLGTTPETVETAPQEIDIWKWKWPLEKLEYNRLKPFFNWTNTFQQ